MFPPGRYPCSKTVKVSRLKYLENIKYCLLILFSRYGNIIDINMVPYSNIRTDAFIFFETRQNARSAVIHMHGYRLFGRPMRVRLSTRGDMYLNQMYSGQVVPSLCLESGLETQSQNLWNGMVSQTNRCPKCHPLSTSTTNQGNQARDSNEAGPSRQSNTQSAEPSTSDDRVVPGTYSSVKRPVALYMNDICLYVSNIPGNDFNAVHYVALMLFQNSIGFQSVHMLPHKRGTVVLTFWSSIQVHLAMTYYNGLKITQDLRLQIRVALRTILLNINNPDLDPSQFFI